MKAGWRTVQLGEICTFNYGKALPESARNGGDTPVFGSNGVVGSHDSSITNGRTIVIGRKGSFGEVNFSAVPSWPIDTAYFVDETSTDQDIRWLYYRLGSLGLNQMNKAAAVPGLNRDDAYRKQLLLPPLPEQRRIAAILDKADALRAKRREALAQLDRLAQSIFVEMFGDPVANPRGWKEATFDQFFLDKTSSCEKLPSSGYLEEGAFPVVDQGQSAIAGFCDDESLLAEVPLPVTVFGDHTRAVKHVDFPFVVGADGAKVLRAVEGVNPRFASHLLATLPIPNLGYSRHMKEVKRLTFVSPPLELQDSFEARLNAVDKAREQHLSAARSGDLLFAAIQHRAFRGEL